MTAELKPRLIKKPAAERPAQTEAQGPLPSVTPQPMWVGMKYRELSDQMRTLSKAYAELQKRALNVVRFKTPGHIDALDAFLRDPASVMAEHAALVASKLAEEKQRKRLHRETRKAKLINSALKRQKAQKPPKRGWSVEKWLEMHPTGTSPWDQYAADHPDSIVAKERRRLLKSISDATAPADSVASPQSPESAVPTAVRL